MSSQRFHMFINFNQANISFAMVKAKETGSVGLRQETANLVLEDRSLGYASCFLCCGQNLDNEVGIYSACQRLAAERQIYSFLQNPGPFTQHGAILVIYLTSYYITPGCELQ